MSDLLIDVAGSADLPGIAALATAIWRAHYPGIISHAQIDYMLERRYDLDVMRDEMASGIVYLRATQDGELRGFAAVGRVAPAEAKLHKLYIHPDHQRRGIGAALMARSEIEAVAMGARQIVLNVNKLNRSAIAAYRKHGFTVRESIIVDIGGGFVMDDYLMVKSVAAPSNP
jgi:ribosomal protein S18 acetylase RimI-like enzyme